MQSFDAFGHSSGRCDSLTVGCRRGGGINEEPRIEHAEELVMVQYDIERLRSRYERRAPSANELWKLKEKTYAGGKRDRVVADAVAEPALVERPLVVLAERELFVILFGRRTKLGGEILWGETEREYVLE